MTNASSEQFVAFTTLSWNYLHTEMCAALV